MGIYEFLLVFNLVVGTLNLAFALRNLVVPGGHIWVGLLCAACAVLNGWGFMNALQEITA